MRRAPNGLHPEGGPGRRVLAEPQGTGRELVPEDGEWTLTCGFDWSYHEKAVLDLDERKLRTHFKEVASPDVDFNV